jgi:hypothetical protein
MNKALLYGCITLGGVIGSYIPSLWHADFLSLSSILLGGVGGLVGIWVAFKLNNYFGM